MKGGGIALKTLQWITRGLQFLCTAVVLALFSYFLATLHNHGLNIATWIRAVEGISGAGVLYTLVGLLLLCFVAGHIFTSGIAIILDVAFIGAFIYVAWMTRGGNSSCTGYVSTPFGAGDANSSPTSNKDGFTSLPSLKEACKMQKACFAVSIAAIILFLLSIFIELALIRHHRKESRYGPSPANNYTSGSGRRGGFFGRFRRNKTQPINDPNALPSHTTPNQVRDSYATETTAVGQEPATYNKYGESGYGQTGTTGAGYGHTGHHANGVTGTQPTTDYRYNDGTYDRV